LGPRAEADSIVAQCLDRFAFTGLLEATDPTKDPTR